jgi:hypothetical protein
LNGNALFVVMFSSHCRENTAAKRSRSHARAHKRGGRDDVNAGQRNSNSFWKRLGSWVAAIRSMF